MRIVFLTNAFTFGGAQMSSVELAARLQATHSVKFLDIYGSSEPFINSLKNNKLDYTLMAGSSAPYIIRKFDNRLLTLFRSVLFVFKWLKIRYRVHSELSICQPDIVLVYDDRSLSFLSGIRNRKFKIYFYARGWYIPGQISFRTRILLKKLPDCIICVSEATRQALYCGGLVPLHKLFVVHNAINVPDVLAPEEEVEECNAKLKIIHPGGFIPEKGQHISLQVAKLLKSRNVDFHLFLCGIIYPGTGNKSDKYYRSLIEFSNQNGLTEHVTFVLNRINILSFINSCDIMIFPSESEGLPRSVIEAMAFGKPVIANAVGGVTDLILDNYTGFLPGYNDPVAYADIVERLIINKDLYSEISGNAHALIKNCFTEELQLRKINELLNDIFPQSKYK